MKRTREERSLILQLFGAFFRIGPSTFGGGYAMIPVIEREILEKRQWINEKEMADMISLSGSAPGGVGVNAAAFVGYRKAGFAGAVAAVAGITLPTFLIVLTLSFFYILFHDNDKVEAALKGIHGAVIALILMAAYRMAKQAVFDVATAILSVMAVVILLLLQISPIYMIAFGIVGGIVLVKGKQWIGLRVQTEKEIRPASSQEPVYPEYYI